MNPTIRLMLVDDHPMVRLGLTSMLRTQPDMAVIAEAGTVSEAVSTFHIHRPDVVMMDLRLPDGSGADCTAAIRAKERDARIIIMTTYDGEENIFRALSAGAKAYLLKDVSHDLLISTIRAVYRGEYMLPIEVAQIVARRLPESELSAREVAILGLIAKGLANKEVGHSLGIAESTVKGHVNHILSKMRARDRTEAVTLALKRGLISI